jgi:hypothetical protein
MDPAPSRHRPGTAQLRALDYLRAHPRSTVTDVTRALTGSARSGRTEMMKAMLYAGLVTRDWESRPGAAGLVQVWSAAPPGTVPPPRPPSPPGAVRRKSASRQGSRARSTRAAITAALAAAPGLNTAEIAAAAGLRHRPVRQLRVMAEEGLLVTRPGTDSRGHACTRYYPAPDGTPAPGISAARRAELDRRSAARRAAFAADGTAADRLEVIPPCTAEDPEIFFPVFLSAADVAKARSVCARCPVRPECLAGASARAEPHGIWGGQVFENGHVVPGRGLAAAGVP